MSHTARVDCHVFYKSIFGGALAVLLQTLSMTKKLSPPLTLPAPVCIKEKFAAFSATGCLTGDILAQRAAADPYGREHGETDPPSELLQNACFLMLLGK